MAKGYWIARVDVRDMESYKGYLQANAEPLRKYGGKFLVRSGKYHCPEGGHRTRNVVLEFPSYQAACDCWYSPEYQAAIPKRTPFSEGDFIIIEAYEGPQP